MAAWSFPEGRGKNFPPLCTIPSFSHPQSLVPCMARIAPECLIIILFFLLFFLSLYHWPCFLAKDTCSGGNCWHSLKFPWSSTEEWNSQMWTPWTKEAEQMTATQEEYGVCVCVCWESKQATTASISCPRPPSSLGGTGWGSTLQGHFLGCSPWIYQTSLGMQLPCWQQILKPKYQRFIKCFSKNPNLHERLGLQSNITIKCKHENKGGDTWKYHVV